MQEDRPMDESKRNFIKGGIVTLAATLFLAATAEAAYVNNLTHIEKEFAKSLSSYYINLYKKGRKKHSKRKTVIDKTLGVIEMDIYNKESIDSRLRMVADVEGNKHKEAAELIKNKNNVRDFREQVKEYFLAYLERERLYQTTTKYTLSRTKEIPSKPPQIEPPMSVPLLVKR